ncbi:hypothetical protein U9M48_013562 [Paspalum notatum var. saurae]|uniref:Uncharacterized protein n=1 Tax=Paspalum notatum var. saurae TaxID=547442 RepID=A0AAQ3SZP7_PASNO
MRRQRDRVRAGQRLGASKVRTWESMDAVAARFPDELDHEMVSSTEFLHSRAARVCGVRETMFTADGRLDTSEVPGTWESTDVMATRFFDELHPKMVSINNISL